MRTETIAMPRKPMFTVTERALARRINRRLRPDGSTLKKCSRRSRWWRDLGDYYTVDDNNNIVDLDVDVEALGREMKAIGLCERVSDPD